MLRGLWGRLSGRRTAAALEHEVERERMTGAERRQDDESLEDRQTDLETQARLGGFDPGRLLPDDRPEHH